MKTSFLRQHRATLGCCVFLGAAAIAASCSSEAIGRDPAIVQSGGTAGASAGQAAAGGADGGRSPGGGAGLGGGANAGSGGSGGAQAEAGGGGAAGRAGAAGGSGAGGLGALPTACPTDAPGAKMVRIERADGRAACIDEREVTQAEYHAFASSMTIQEWRDLPFCAPGDDGIIQDSYGWPEPDTGNEHQDVYGICKFGLYQPDKTPSAAAGCLFACQARAYCAWAGKQLCGRFDTDEPLDEKSAVDPTLSVWAAACTNGGATKRSHASEAANACGETWPTSSEISDASPEAHPDCHGQGAYAGVYNLSGGLTEYVNGWTTATETLKSVPLALGPAPFPVPGSESCGRALVGQPDWAGGFRCCQRLAPQ